VRDGLVLHGAESDAEAAWEAFPDRLKDWPGEEEPLREVSLAMTALAVLGYDPNVLDEAIFTFRRMEGLPLNEEGITPDFKTRIRARIADRYF
jgi:hypothetical protein